MRQGHTGLGRRDAALRVSTPASAVVVAGSAAGVLESVIDSRSTELGQKMSSKSRERGGKRAEGEDRKIKKDDEHTGSDVHCVCVWICAQKKERKRCLATWVDYHFFRCCTAFFHPRLRETVYSAPQPNH